MTGTLGIDTVTLGDPLLGSAAIKVPSTTFGQATRLAKEFAKVPLDGMLGLAYKSVAVDDVQPVFQAGESSTTSSSTFSACSGFGTLRRASFYNMARGIWNWIYRQTVWKLGVRRVRF